MQILHVIQDAAVAWTMSLLAVSAQTGGSLTDRLIFMDGVANCFYGSNNLTDAQDCIGLGTERCMDADPAQNQTTSGMMFCARAEGEVWDRLLKGEYREAVTDLRQMDAEAVELFPEFANREAALRAVHRAWLALRDADCQLEYAMCGPGMWGPGSIRQIAGSYCVMERSAERTIYLRFLGDQRRRSKTEIKDGDQMRRSNVVIRIIDTNNR